MCGKIVPEFPLFGASGGLNVYRLHARQKRYRHGAELLNPSRKSGEIAIISNSTKEKLDANYQPIGA